MKTRTKKNPNELATYNGHQNEPPLLFTSSHLRLMQLHSYIKQMKLTLRNLILKRQGGMQKYTPTSSKRR